jgi:hypothetical protein
MQTSIRVLLVSKLVTTFTMHQSHLSFSFVSCIVQLPMWNSAAGWGLPLTSWQQMEFPLAYYHHSLSFICQTSNKTSTSLLCSHFTGWLPLTLRYPLLELTSHTSELTGFAMRTMSSLKKDGSLLEQSKTLRGTCATWAGVKHSEGMAWQPLAPNAWFQWIGIGHCQTRSLVHCIITRWRL